MRRRAALEAGQLRQQAARDRLIRALVLNGWSPTRATDLVDDLVSRPWYPGWEQHEPSPPDPYLDNMRHLPT